MRERILQCLLACTLVIASVGCAGKDAGYDFAEAPVRMPDGQFQFSELSADGHLIVNEAGEPVALRGVNLGNWFLLEMWMLGIDHAIFDDQYSYIKKMEERWGVEEAHRLMDIYRENWMTKRDFEIIQTFDMNCIRLPIHYSILESDARPFEVRPGGWRWLDHAVDMAEQHGLYVILDLHGAAGGQTEDHISGRRGDNELWESEENIQRTEWFWRIVAERYRDRNSVAAYDLLNEAWGTDNATLERVAVRLLDAVREVDPDTLVIMPDKYSDSSFYGNPTERGWSNVMYTAHFYPGFFGNGRPIEDTHVKFILNELPRRDQLQRDIGVPMLIGEFQVSLKDAGGGEMMRRYFDVYNGYGWAATKWSYKVLKTEGGIGMGAWGMVVNEEPFEPVTPMDATKEEMEAYFRSLSTMKYEIDEDLRYWMTTDRDLPAMPDPLPERKKRTRPSHTDPLPAGWHATEVGESLPGGQQVISPNEMMIYGGGNDIWAEQDQFRFVWQKVKGDFTISAQVTSLEFLDAFSKAGLMVRGSLDPDAPHAFICAFPSGGVEMGWRMESGDVMSAEGGGQGEFPNISFRIRRAGSDILIDYSTAPGEWKTEGPLSIPAIGEVAYVGIATLSHDNSELVEATYSNIQFEGETVEPTEEELMIGMREPLPTDLPPAGWEATDIGDANPGAQKVHSSSALDLYGAGEDIWAAEDQFRFLWQQISGDFTLTATLNSLGPVEEYTKGGLMVRNSLDSDSGMAMVCAFPDGGIEFTSRRDDGETATGGESASAEFPGIRFRLARRGDGLFASFAEEDGDWSEERQLLLEDPKSRLYVGMAALSHDDSQHTVASFSDIQLVSE